ncbi:anti-sigma factor antagonist [Streptomyces sp. SDr-06]|uniref:STAS domain-containing protein n=1 Tax=Streptomyces sp. SDr-06 TaxID=2267702 RepID=UPI000DE903B9|nr:STAS domain-containing protein [Streptomyces sp. SDr-06]RCH64228.1 anti-sigma factor antagonist [Streptomyces sp. SDr-06]
MDRLTVRHASCEDTSFLTLVLAGELEVSNVSKLIDTIVGVLERGDRHLLLDLTDVSLCDEGSLFTILGIRHAANHLGGSLSIIAASPPVHDAMCQTGLRELLPITPGCPL